MSRKNCNQKEFGEILYEQNYHQLKAYFMAYCHEEMSAEDMVQTLFLKILCLDTLDEDTAHRLVFSTARNMIIDDVRHREQVRKAQQYMECFCSTESEPPVYDQMERECMLKMEAAYVNSMPRQRAHIYRMWREGMMTEKMIAEKMNLSLRTVEHHIYLAKRGLKEYFRKAL